MKIMALCLFKYLETTAQSSGDCGREVKNSVQTGWNSWKRYQEGSVIENSVGEGKGLQDGGETSHDVWLQTQG